MQTFTPTSLDELDALVAEHITAQGHSIFWFTDIFGRTPMVWDETARRTSETSTNARLIGATWKKGKDDDGNTVEIYARSVPHYSQQWHEAATLIEACRQQAIFLGLLPATDCYSVATTREQHLESIVTVIYPDYWLRAGTVAIALAFARLHGIVIEPEIEGLTVVHN